MGLCNPRCTYCPLVPKRNIFYVTDGSPILGTTWVDFVTCKFERYEQRVLGPESIKSWDRLPRQLYNSLSVCQASHAYSATFYIVGFEICFDIYYQIHVPG